MDIIDNIQRLNPLEAKPLVKTALSAEAKPLFNSPLRGVDSILMYSLEDIGVQKLSLLGNRICKKDFYDLDHITDIIPLEVLLKSLKRKKRMFQGKIYENIFDLHSLGCPTERQKLLLSYIELYPGDYDDDFKRQVIGRLHGKTWEEAEKSWIRKARAIIYGREVNSF